jgi:methionyl-tRNA synthetase
MSKSRGNIVRPEPIRQAMGADALRYYLLREIVFGADGNFAYDAMVTRYNADLANGLGNLASRTLSMIQQYRGSIIPAPPAAAALPLANNIAAATAAAIDAYEKFEFSKGLEAIWQLIGAADKYIVEQAPWKLFKAKEEDKLNEVLYSIADALRAATLLAAPVLPESTAKIWRLLGYATPLTAERFGQLEAGQLPAGQAIPPVEPVFPRLEMQPTIDKMNELEEIEKARQDLLLGKTPEPAAPADPGGIPLASQITIDDFVKVDLRVGQVKFAEKVKGSDKLLHMKIDIGEAEPRTIVAGISQVYDPESMLGRKVVIVANLAPRKLKGIESHGMIVAASTADGKPTVAGFLEDVPVGARLK